MVYQLILVTTFQTNIGGVKLAFNSLCWEVVKKGTEIYNFDVAPIPTLHMVVRIYSFPFHKNENPQFTTFLRSVLINQHELKLLPIWMLFHTWQKQYLVYTFWNKLAWAMALWSFLLSSLIERIDVAYVNLV